MLFDPSVVMVIGKGENMWFLAGIYISKEEKICDECTV